MHRYLATHKDASLPLFPESIGYKWQQESVSRSTGYPYFHWLQTTSGSGEIIIDNQHLPLNANQGLLISPFTPHHYHAVGTTPWETSFFTFGGTLSTELSRSIGLEKYLFLQDLSEPLQHFIPQTFPLLQTNDEKTHFDVSTKIYGFLMNIRYASHLQEVPTADYQEVITPILDFIQQHYTEPITNNQLATKTGYSPQHLARLFKTHFRMTPLQYLLELRIRKAKEQLISNPTTSIQHISESVGFNSLSYFTATFKKAEGLAPHQFRKLYR